MDIRYPKATPNINEQTIQNMAGVPKPTGMIPAEVYRDRRRRLLEKMGTGVAVIFSADSIGKGQRQDLDFYYLTGLEYEAGAALLLAPEHPHFKEQLFLSALDIEDTRWHGTRLMLGRALDLGTGFAKTKRISLLAPSLVEAVLYSAKRELVYLGPIVGYQTAIPKQLQVLRDASARILGSSIRDGHEILPRMRSIHDAYEIEVMSKAIGITTEAFKLAMKTVQPGMNEGQLQSVFENHFRANLCKANAYEPIVGAGGNSCVLHYTQNNQQIKDGDLVLCDVGCEFEMYASDITRTFPANGKFSPRQREIYTIVLNAWKAAVAIARPGTTWQALNDAARQVIEDAGYADEYFHSVGHFVGLYVHDAGIQREVLSAGMVITVEPGIYLASEGIGIRIEDDILITEDGCRVLSANLPREIDEIEQLMAKA
jgi:Xaa-Pro aminopeptidase